jgi:NAD dependent epimerase/dehydratase family enzyme
LQDAVAILRLAIENGSLRGPVNVVSPQPVRNAHFTSCLAKVLHRPALFPVPAFALRIVMGEMADALLLASQRVEPACLKKLGYPFLQPELESALRAILS